MQTTSTPKSYVAVLEQLVTERLAREPERKAITGVSRAHWARLEHAGKAPRKIQVSERIVAWRLTDLQRWVYLKARGGRGGRRANARELLKV